MPWTKKQVAGQRIEFTAPQDAWPMKKVTYDPRPNRPKWSVEYEWLSSTDDSLLAIEALMGL